MTSFVRTMVVIVAAIITASCSALPENAADPQDTSRTARDERVLVIRPLATEQPIPEPTHLR